MKRKRRSRRVLPPIDPNEALALFEADLSIVTYRQIGAQLDPPRDKSAVRKCMIRHGRAERLELEFAIRREEQFEEERTTLLMYLLLVSFVIDRTPDKHDLEEYGLPSHWSIIHFCGGMADAQEEVGLPPNPMGQWGHKDTRIPLEYLRAERTERLRAHPHCLAQVVTEQQTRSPWSNP